ncbi:hypothetical protein JX265_003827 [Neoarthrinium moseri]|uniref:DUF6546 domain-containing protein n=1 Tax=Neoarthrinium moseri TaxID=1658444 RepID=A0A9P9WR93_9PEZI|nr:hypothetical protein JX265_003827 [Neoarthrinium moseri]
MRPHFSEGLPLVKAVPSFILRRQTRRSLCAVSLQKILKSLPNLQSMKYEPWRDFFRLPRYIQDPYYQKTIFMSLPEALRTLTVFEDFNEGYNIVHFDAKGLLEACQPGWMWANLETLTLTSKLLPLYKPRPVAINKMLVKAGTAAIWMPRFQNMVIWNGLKRHACAFRYQVTANSTTLGWCGTWELELDIDVLDVWGEVALRHTRNELSVLASRSIDKQDIQSHAAAIRELNLSEVISPISLE